MLIKDKLDKIVFLLLCILIVLFPINYKLELGMRFFDVLYIFTFLLFLCTNFKVQKIFIAIFLGIVSVLMLSMWSYLQTKSIEFQKIIFVYKYFVLFSIPLLVSNIVNTPYRVKVINSFMIWVFIVLLVWVYTYLVLNAFDIINGNRRPSFPFSNNYRIPDSHLFSSILGFFTITYLFYWRIFFKHKSAISLFILLNALFALVLTGSRTGIILVIFSVIVYVVYKILMLRRIKIKNSTFLKYISLGIIIISLFLIFQDIVFFVIEKNILLIERALNFDFKNNTSAQGRIFNLFLALDEIKATGYFFGSGILYSSLIWYDGIIAILLAHGGILLLIGFFVFIATLVYKSYLYTKHKENKVYFLTFLLFLSTYVLSNGITEYVLVSRNAFPALVVLSLLYTINKNKILNSGN